MLIVYFNESKDSKFTIKSTCFSTKYRLQCQNTHKYYFFINQIKILP